MDEGTQRVVSRLIDEKAALLRALENMVANQHTKSEQLSALLYNEARAAIRAAKGETT